MADTYQPLFDGLRQTAAALVQAGEANQQAIAALQRAGATIAIIADTAMDAREEHEDLRVTVHRLEGLVLQLSTEIRELRDRPSQ